MRHTRRRILHGVGAMVLLTLLVPGPGRAEDAGRRLRLLVIGAHPDDADSSGGTMARYVALGHTVKLVSLTNGDAGHFETGLGPLAVRRAAEARCAGQVIGSEYVTLDNHDGELMPTLEVRRQVIRLIREFQPDLVFTPRVDDYHPDHRATAELVRDAAYMVTVPNVVPLTPHLDKNPVFVNVEDRFTRPTPFQPDVVVDIDAVVEQKVDMYHCHTSQMYEWLPYNQGVLDQVPEGDAARRAWLAKRLKARWRATAERFRDRLVALYGPERGSRVEHAEAFAISEYGSAVPEEELKRLFPFFEQAATDPCTGLNSLTEDEAAEGWVLLFDGRSLAGWHGYNGQSTEAWTIEDCALKSVGTEGNYGSDKRADLTTDREYTDFELSLEWKATPGANSGVLYGVIEDPKYDAPWKTGPEYQFIDDIGFPEKLEDWQLTGANYAMHVAGDQKELKPVGQWNTSRIVVHGPRVEHWLNGKKILEFERWTDEWNDLKNAGKWKDEPDYGAAKAGRIVIQDHGSVMWFRNVRVRELPPEDAAS